MARFLSPEGEQTCFLGHPLVCLLLTLEFLASWHHMLALLVFLIGSTH